MAIEERVAKLEREMKTLQESYLQSQINLTPMANKVEDTASKVAQITPYTATKQAYYGDTEVTFYDVPYGCISVFIDGYNNAYSINRTENRLRISFEPLDKQTLVTIFIQ